MDEALIEAGLSAPEIVECGNPQVAQALAAAGRGIAVVSDDPRFDLVPLRIRGRHGLLTLTLHAAWDPRHHAAAELERLAVRLRDFCAMRTQMPTSVAVRWPRPFGEEVRHQTRSDRLGRRRHLATFLAITASHQTTFSKNKRIQGS